MAWCLSRSWAEFQQSYMQSLVYTIASVASSNTLELFRDQWSVAIEFTDPIGGTFAECLMLRFSGGSWDLRWSPLSLTLNGRSNCACCLAWVCACSCGRPGRPSSMNCSWWNSGAKTHLDYRANRYGFETCPSPACLLGACLLRWVGIRCCAPRIDAL